MSFVMVNPVMDIPVPPNKVKSPVTPLSDETPAAPDRDAVDIIDNTNAGIISKSNSRRSTAVRRLANCRTTGVSIFVDKGGNRTNR
jgi:hypothetical protein